MIRLAQWLSLLALLSEDLAQERDAVRQAVALQGFYAGEPVGATDCAGCHAEIAVQWAGSAHRFASFNNPYYSAAVDAFRRDRAPAAARFCGGCHDPLLVEDGAIGRDPLQRDTPRAQAGVVCLVCHSIHAVPAPASNGGYALRATPVPGPADAAAHAARLRPALLSQGRLCSVCHKVGLDPEITGVEWHRGQDDYDAWQQSLAAGTGVAAIYREARPRTCQDCHMPLEETASGRKVRSHRFLGANTALPMLRQDEKMRRRTEEFLRGAVALDLLVMTREGPSLQQEVQIGAAPVLVDVVLRNRRVGHRFPGGTMDSNEAYLVVEARSGGRTLRNADHVLRAQPVDADGAPLLRRDVQHLRGVVYDTSLGPADPQVVRYVLDPREFPAGAPIEVSAVLRYRKFSPAYAAFACAELPPGPARDRCLAPPVVEIAAARRTLRRGPARPGLSAGDFPPWQRYLDHGLGLADGLAEQVGAALPSLRKAAQFAPDRIEPQLGLARVSLALSRTAEVLAAGARADAIQRDHPAALWLRALALYRSYRFTEARPYLERAARRLPEDRNVLGLLSRLRGLLGPGEAAGALALADRLLLIDPESEEGHYQRMFALRDLRRPQEAEAAERKYLYYRRPVERDQELRALFRRRYPALAEEDVPAHRHRLR